MEYSDTTSFACGFEKLLLALLYSLFMWSSFYTCLQLVWISTYWINQLNICEKTTPLKTKFLLGFNRIHQYCVLGGKSITLFFPKRKQTIDFSQQNFTVLRVLFPLQHPFPACICVAEMKMCWFYASTAD